MDRGQRWNDDPANFPINPKPRHRRQPNAGTALPAAVPSGIYDVNVKLFADGAMVGDTRSAFKVGFEWFIAAAAHQHGLAYDLADTSRRECLPVRLRRQRKCIGAAQEHPGRFVGYMKGSIAQPTWRMCDAASPFRAALTVKERRVHRQTAQN